MEGGKKKGEKERTERDEKKEGMERKENTRTKELKGKIKKGQKEK